MGGLAFEYLWSAAELELGGTGSTGDTPTPPTPPTPPPDTGGTGGTGGTGVVTSSLRGKPNFSASDVPSALADWYTRSLSSWAYIPDSERKVKLKSGTKWLPEYANQYVWKTCARTGERYRSYTGPSCGAYTLGRQGAFKSYGLVSHGLRATGDLTYLDVACGISRHFLDQLDDQGGINTTVPDGFLSIVSGTDGQRRISFGPGDSRNTAMVRTVNGVEDVYYPGQDNGNGTLSSNPSSFTGEDLQLEDGLMLVGPMISGLAAHVNADQYSPQYEPLGSRPSTPRYYAKLRDDACKFFEDMRAKWLKKGANGNKKFLPFAVREDLSHSFLNEMVSYVCYAKIKGGANWKTHWAYLEVKRAWGMAFGPYEKAGNGVNPNAKCTYYEDDVPGVGTCIVWSHRINRWNPGSSKDITGEYISTASSSNAHPNAYTEHDYGALIFLFMEGCDFITETFLSKVANTINATLNHNAKSNRLGYDLRGGVRMPYMMHGYRDAGIQPPSGWVNQASSTGSSDNPLTNGPFSGMMAFDRNSELPGYFKARWDALSATDKKQKYGATTAQLFNAAYRAGLVKRNT